MQDTNIYELTNPQKSIWVTEQFYKGTSINNICGVAEIKEFVDFDLLKKAITHVMEKYDIFKINFYIEKSEIKQKITEKYNDKIDVIDLTSEKELEQYKNSIVKERFDLLNNYPYQFYIFKFSNNQGAFMLNIHHIIADAWTLGFISREIIKIYSKLKTNSYVEEEIKYSYKQYLDVEKKYIESEKYEKDKKYWESKFSSTPCLASIECEKKGKLENNPEAKRELFKIDKKIINKINKYCDKKKVSLYNFFMAIYGIYISEISNLNRFALGTPILNRTNHKEKQTPGMFISTHAFLIDLEGVKDFNTFLQNIAKDTYNMLKHQRYPYQKLLEYVREKNKNIPNLYNILLSYQITNAQNKEENIKYVTDWTFNGNSADNLAIHIYDINDSGSLNIAYDYRANLFSKQEIQNMHYRILHIIKQVILKENIDLKNIDIVTPKEKRELIYKLNESKLEYDKNIPIIKYFEKQVKKHPKELALVFENATMTYEELNERANSLASLLRRKGVKNNTVVGIMEHRSFEMIVAIIAVLKAGGAFIPIAPEYPDNRIEYMLKDSNAEVLLTEKSLEDRVNFKKTKIFITLDNSYIYNFNKKNIANISKKDDLSYIIYTSGSTRKA